MQERLIVYLHAENPEHPSWAVIDSLGNVQHSETQNNAQDLSTFAINREVIIAVPAQDVLLTRAILPKMSRARLLHALPYALEEELADDIECLHFAPIDYQSNGEVSVAVVGKEKMDQWFALIQSWKMSPDCLLPITLASSWQEKAWLIRVESVAQVRTHFATGFACDIENLNEMLKLEADHHNLPEIIHVMNYTGTPIANQLTLPTTIKETLRPHSALITDVACELGNSSSFNLLQGLYAVKKSKLPRTKRLGKVAIGLSIACITLLFLYPIVSYYILKQRVQMLDQQIAQIYKRHFPQSMSIVAPKMRMEEKLRKLSTQTSENRFLTLTSYLGRAINITKNIQLKRLDYQNKQLTIEMTSPSSADFAAFTHTLTQQGLTVKQQNANLTGAKINATLLIE